MVEIFGKLYYIDIDSVTKKCELVVESRLPETDIEETDDDTETDLIPVVDQTINIFKYEMVKMCIDTVLTEGVPDDPGMGLFSQEISIPFKIAFNTLIKYGILIESEDE